nr:MAG TPA: hypothetical protein [Caudoviricetes sp.]
MAFSQNHYRFVHNTPPKCDSKMFNDLLHLLYHTQKRAI